MMHPLCCTAMHPQQLAGRKECAAACYAGIPYAEAPDAYWQSIFMFITKKRKHPSPTKMALYSGSEY